MKLKIPKNSNDQLLYSSHLVGSNSIDLDVRCFGKTFQTEKIVKEFAKACEDLSDANMFIFDSVTAMSKRYAKNSRNKR